MKFFRRSNVIHPDIGGGVIFDKEAEDKIETANESISDIDSRFETFGSAKSATKLYNKRKIGNTQFDGSSDITLAQMGAEASGVAEKYTDNKVGDLADVNITDDDNIIKTTIVSIINHILSIITSHINNKDNPHKVTKSQIGLGKVDNTADSDKSVKYATTSGSSNSVAWGSVSGKPSTFTPSSHTHSYLPLTGGVLTGNTQWNNGNLVIYNNKSTTSNRYDGAIDIKTVLSSNTSKKGQIRIGSNYKGESYVQDVIHGVNMIVSDSSGNLCFNGKTCSYTSNTLSINNGDLNVVTGTINCVNGSGWINGAGVYTNVSGANVHLRANNGGYAVTGGASLNVLSADFTRYVYVNAQGFNSQSSKLVKENIEDLDEESTVNILKLRPVTFNYKKNFGGQTGCIGLIAEEVLPYFPAVVNIPDGYDESEFDEEKGINQKILSIDYSKFIPYLIKMIQIQDKRITTLEEEVKSLKTSSSNVTMEE